MKDYETIRRSYDKSGRKKHRWSQRSGDATCWDCGLGRRFARGKPIYFMELSESPWMTKAPPCREPDIGARDVRPMKRVIVWRHCFSDSFRHAYLTHPSQRGMGEGICCYSRLYSVDFWKDDPTIPRCNACLAVLSAAINGVSLDDLAKATAIAIREAAKQDGG